MELQSIAAQFLRSTSTGWLADAFVLSWPEVDILLNMRYYWSHLFGGSPCALSTAKIPRSTAPASRGRCPSSLIEEHYDEFERVYPDRFQRKYGFWRPVVRRAVNDYLDCGDPREGFARVRCPDCHHEFFVAFSCKSA